MISPTTTCAHLSIHDGYGKDTPQRLNLVYCDKHSPGLLEDELECTIISSCKLDVRLLVIINAITTLTVELVNQWRSLFSGLEMLQRLTPPDKAPHFISAIFLLG